MLLGNRKCMIIEFIALGIFYIKYHICAVSNHKLILLLN